MTFTLNGTLQELKKSMTLAQVLKEYYPELQSPGIAIALNQEVIEEAQWIHAQIQKGDDVEILQAACGG
jgi:thiamine biosynthesis protein ThiS